MALVKEDDTDAFRQIIQHHQTPLLNFFCRLGAYIDRAEDCVQETFIKLFNYRYKYRPTAKFTTFLYTLARHTWVDECRRRRRFPSNPLYQEGAGGVLHTPKSPLIRGDFRSGNCCVDNRLDIQMALGKLSDKLRMTVVLSIYQGLTYEEIGRILKIPVGTVKSRMSLAFQQLREVLGDDQ